MTSVGAAGNVVFPLDSDFPVINRLGEEDTVGKRNGLALDALICVGVVLEYFQCSLVSVGGIGERRFLPYREIHSFIEIVLEGQVRSPYPEVIHIVMMPCVPTGCAHVHYEGCGILQIQSGEDSLRDQFSVGIILDLAAECDYYRFAGPFFRDAGLDVADLVSLEHIYAIATVICVVYISH